VSPPLLLQILSWPTGRLFCTVMSRYIKFSDCFICCFTICRYCDPSYAFPPQSDVVHFAVSLAEKAAHEDPNTLFVVGSYTIGKERIFTGMYKYC